MLTLCVLTLKVHNSITQLIEHAKYEPFHIYVPYRMRLYVSWITTQYTIYIYHIIYYISPITIYP